MAYKENSISFSVGGYNSYKTSTVDYTNHYAKATFSASTSGSTLSWSITMSTSTPSGAPKVAIYLSIDGKQQIDVGPAGTNNNYSDNYSGFPCKNGSTLSGTVDIGTKTSIPIILTVGPATNNADYWFVNSTDGTSKTTRHGATKYLTRIYYESPGLPTVTITNTKNNSFTVQATKGSNDSSGNNIANGVTNIQYSYDNSTWTAYTSAVTITEDKKVYARAKTDGSISDSGFKTVGPVDVYYYTAPTQASNLAISSSKSKNTPKANYTFSWTNPTAGKHNPLSYVLFKLYKNGTQISNDADYQMKDGRTSITFTPQQLGGLTKGDTLYFSVDGLATNTNFDLGPATSESTTIVNAAVLKVKTEEGWKEGQAFVKTKDGWKEASSVFIKSAKGWKEPK